MGTDEKKGFGLMKKALTFLNKLKPSGIDLSANPLQIKTQILQVTLLISTLYGSMHLNQSLRAEDAQTSAFFIAGLLFFTIASAAMFFLMRLSLSLKLNVFLVLVFLQAQAIFFNAGWSVLALALLLIFTILGAINSRKIASVLCLLLTLLSLAAWMIVTIQNDQAVLLEGSTAFLLFGSIHVLVRLLFKKLEGASTSEAQATNIEDKVQTRELRKPDDLSTELLEILATEADTLSGVKAVTGLVCGLPGVYFAGVFQTDLAREYAVLLHGSGEEGLQMLNASYRLSVGGFSIVGKSIQSEKTQFEAANLADPSRFENPFLPLSQSEMSIPLAAHEARPGALNVHFSHQEEPGEDTRHKLERAAQALSILLARSSIEKVKPSPRTIWAPVPDAGWKVNSFHAEYQKTDAGELTEIKNITLPVMLRHEKIGSLLLETRNGELSDKQQQLINTAVALAVTEIENLYQVEGSKRKAEMDRTIYEISSKLHATADATQMMRTVLQDLCRALGVQKAQIVLNVPELSREEPEDTSETRSLVNKPTTGPLVEG